MKYTQKELKQKLLCEEVKKEDKQDVIFDYIIYKYDIEKNDIQYIKSNNNIISAINDINGLLLKDNDKTNLIKDIDTIIKNRHIDRYITLDINNIKVIKDYIIFKHYYNNNGGKNILSKEEKQAINNDLIEVNKIYKKEVKQEIKKVRKQLKKRWSDKTYKLNEIERQKRILLINSKINQKNQTRHENKLIKGGLLYEI